MSSAKTKKKRKKQRLRLKKKKFRLKERLKKLDRLAELCRNLIAAMAAFNSSKGTEKPILQDGLDLHCNKHALKALKAYSQPLEATTNDLDPPQSRAGHYVRSSFSSEASEAPKARQLPEQLFRMRTPPAKKSPSNEPPVRTPRTTTWNRRRVMQASAILVKPTVPTAPNKFSWRILAHHILQLSLTVQTAFKAFTPRAMSILQAWSWPTTATPSPFVTFTRTGKFSHNIPKPPVRYLRGQPGTTAQATTAIPAPGKPTTGAPQDNYRRAKQAACSDKNRERHKSLDKGSVRKYIALEDWDEWLKNRNPVTRCRSNSWSVSAQPVKQANLDKEPMHTNCLEQPIARKKPPRRNSESCLLTLAAGAQQIDAVGIPQPQVTQLIQAAGTLPASILATLSDGFPMNSVTPSRPPSAATYFPVRWCEY